MDTNIISQWVLECEFEMRGHTFRACCTPGSAMETSEVAPPGGIRSLAL